MQQKSNHFKEWQREAMLVLVNGKLETVLGGAGLTRQGTDARDRGRSRLDCWEIGNRIQQNKQATLEMK